MRHDFFQLHAHPRNLHSFPTRTLFRSERLCHRLAILDNGRIIAEGSPRALIAEHIEAQVVEVHGAGYEAMMRDRKSTRLNSSHPSISYAVFCLKKKK